MIEYQGNYFLVHCSLDSGQVVQVMQPDGLFFISGLDEGDRVMLNWNEADMNIFQNM